MKLPDATAAVEKEWDRPEDLLSADTSKVRDREDVIRRVEAQNIPVHLATFMDLCHLKQSELGAHLQTCRGRGVLRGDPVKRRNRMQSRVHKNNVRQLLRCQEQKNLTVSVNTRVKMKDVPRLGSHVIVIQLTGPKAMTQ